MSNLVIPDKKKLTILSAILLILGILTVIVLYNINSNIRSKTTHTPKELDVSKIIALSDSPFYLELPYNPSTGYQWQADFDTKILKLNNLSYRKQSTKDKTGTEEVQIFEFFPLEKGNTEINLRYVRPWEPDTPPQQTKNYEVVIN